MTYQFQNLTYLVILTKNIYLRLVKFRFLPKKAEIFKIVLHAVDGIINIIDTQFSGSYRLPIPKSNLFSVFVKNVYFRLIKLLFLTKNGEIFKIALTRVITHHYHL